MEKFYKYLFFKLFNSKGSSDQNSIWFKFRKENLKIDVDQILSICDEEQQEILKRHLVETKDIALFISKLEKDELLDETFWQRFFIHIRNQIVRNKHQERKLNIACSGTNRKMTMHAAMPSARLNTLIKE